MKKMLGLYVVCLVWMAPGLWAIPTTITYQGTLQEKNVPVNGTRKMIFRITADIDGKNASWTSDEIPVMVTNGLFSTELSPTGVPWETITPFIELTVEGKVLLPRERINATVYAVVSNTVVDGAITPAKVAAGYGLVPSGAIMLFDSACPSGWKRFAPLDNNFPMGGATYGVVGGATNHSHDIDPDGFHTHKTPDLALGSATNGSYPTVYLTSPSPGWVPNYPGQTTDGAGTHSHGGKTHSANNLPPFLEMIYCQKQ